MAVRWFSRYFTDVFVGFNRQTISFSSLIFFIFCAPSVWPSTIRPNFWVLFLVCEKNFRLAKMLLKNNDFGTWIFHWKLFIFNINFVHYFVGHVRKIYYKLIRNRLNNTIKISACLSNTLIVTVEWSYSKITNRITTHVHTVAISVTNFVSSQFSYKYDWKLEKKYIYIYEDR